MSKFKGFYRTFLSKISCGYIFRRSSQKFILLKAFFLSFTPYSKKYSQNYQKTTSKQIFHTWEPIPLKQHVDDMCVWYHNEGKVQWLFCLCFSVFKEREREREWRVVRFLNTEWVCCTQSWYDVRWMLSVRYLYVVRTLILQIPV